jgi:hypothetical protein
MVFLDITLLHKGRASVKFLEDNYVYEHQFG